MSAAPPGPFPPPQPDFVPLPGPRDPGPVTRFAPSPTGYLHAGHAYSALFAYEAAQRGRGRFLLRIEDIDRQRCRPEFEQAILDDLAWLGVRWQGLRRQSDHLERHGRALAGLAAQGLAYPCFCTRKDIRAEIAHMGRAPHGPSGEPIYPGTCRPLSAAERAERIDAGQPYAWRLDVAEANRRAGPLTWLDLRAGEQRAAPESLGDVVLGRKDTPTSYHLACTLDDHLQGVTLVTRGLDLFHATHVHRLLQAIMGLRVPRYYHHNLITDEQGRRLAKRTQATSVRHLRERGLTPADLWRQLGLAPPA